MKVLLIGKNGMLGGYLLKALSGISQVECFSVTRNEIDITSRESVFNYINSLSPDFVINAAAYTNVDGAETDPSLARATNTAACEYLAQACKKNNSVLLHISTDYVFGGDSDRKIPYIESDKTSPINEYGRTKLAGEKLISKNMQKYFILRTSSLFGNDGGNFVDRIIELGRERDYLTVVSDQVSVPTYVLDLSAVIVNTFLKPFLDLETETHELFFQDSSELKKHIGKKMDFGLYHVTSSGACSWYELAKFIMNYLGIDIEIKKVVGNYFNLAAKRPNYSAMTSEKLGYCLRPWQKAVSAYLDLKYKK